MTSYDSSGNDQDYEEWLAHSTDGGDLERDGCVLGVKETYRRLKKQSVCRNGRGYVVRKKQSPCLCTREDYLWFVNLFVTKNCTDTIPNNKTWPLKNRLFRTQACMRTCFGLFLFPCKKPFLSFSTVTMVIIVTWTLQSVWDNPALQIKPWRSVWTERRMSFWQQGNGHSFSK